MSKQTQFLDIIGLRELWDKMCETFPSRTGVGASGKWNIDISGNADTATKLTTENVGGSKAPIYFSNGKPKACGDHLNVDVNTVDGLNSRQIVHGVPRHSNAMDLNTLDSKKSIFTEIRPGEITTSNLPSGYETGYGALLSLRDGNSTYGYGKIQILAKSSGHMWFRCHQSATEAITSTWRLLLDSSN
jgi:hypothetical protein